ncbi:MAG TPA: hypothetical protein PK948_03035 [Gemmatimonadales bacterium]|jgi:hypothetical protein|nr:hypothetical protein [Gemmatimonadales bacterium]
MVMLATDSPIPTYRVYDDSGASVGRIVLPVAARVSGVGAATIFLQRDPPLRRWPRNPVIEYTSPLAGH